MLINAIIGSEQFQGPAAKFQLFDAPPGRTERHISVACRDLTCGITAGGSARVSAGMGMDGAKVGFWTRAHWDVPHGRILKIFGKSKSEWNAREVCAGAYLRAREGADFVEIKMPLSGYAGATYTAAFIEGRFDILREEELEPAGIRITPAFLRFYTQRQVELTFEINIKEIGIPAPVIQVTNVPVSDTDFVQVRVRRRRRVLDFS